MASIDRTELAESLRRLEPSPERDLAAALDLVVAACVELFGVTGSGLMIADEQNLLRYAAASDGPGRVLEHVQTETGQGPCVDTFVKQQVVMTGDMASEDRWPASRETAASHGVRAVLGVPVDLGGVTVGSLDVYRDRPHVWDESERAALVRYSEIVSATLDAGLAAHRAGELAGQLQYALDHRVMIERAVGFVMGRTDLDDVGAFNLLRRAARGSRRRIGEVAREVLDRRDLP